MLGENKTEEQTNEKPDACAWETSNEVNGLNITLSIVLYLILFD